jgi:SAM-dependent methyltransferase
VVGGGSGRFVHELLASGFAGEVLNIDLSPRMLERTRQRVERRVPQALSRVECRLGDMSSLRPAERFDLLCTHCFLDLFEGPRLRQVIDRLDACLANDGLWWCSDFAPPAGGPVRRAAQRLSLSALYTFFRMTCSIDASRLPPIEDELRRLGYAAIQRRDFSAGWLWSGLYRRGRSRPLA